MKTVYRAENLFDAHLVKDALEQAGIPAFVCGEHLIGGVGQLPARDFIAIGVPDSCLDDAGPVVREIAMLLSRPIDHPIDTEPSPWLRPVPT
jgi:Putative prokaryotic signal transducing protein